MTKPTKKQLKKTGDEIIAVFSRILWLKAQRDLIDAELETLIVETKKDRAIRRRKGLSI